MKALLLLTLIAALFCLLLFQTSRSIFVRSAGLFIILACAFVWELQIRAIPHYGLLVLISILMALGFASDYYSASLRTWYFRVSEAALWGVVIGSFAGGFILWMLLGSIGGLITGSLLGAVIGEFKARGVLSFKQGLKTALGACAGVFGMSAKLMFGLEMVFWIMASTPGH
ncbi:hypothetical protein COW36_20985 [bacterium (Candidatus Blackallbacteria) CG17_big_fil_post_rev_8_21_14_2_50_48_46]|uniref:DUF456 domain-containing protein n=1 Tax=bacterium (Candidatus Blackallbacteria) CG17_big_fil_post_rev_8_21_14_2_50_48_46 TaxID=2014261 RepID=A0A2M7FYY5_9BACT|nr:MAG: hypothetical protein COW64_14295 [bacterium (Candidatus Blackallbacteria) CG18_big_fil_WC_8_21_14_2_50_49_26]PIW14518.1 MAG: hypothetical protein COW36_20985 [bacterium (Candidatus Blackallbacteria) CG17_big_fil_post_rev_8_21_14_2_50_48_46]PIW47203.1 MAG: hypothetical protein COW20_13430 [bacterium (Candidatus Blackallbacteria) CG13_big_fil_rev_8_21_14_2_50_49_14]